MAQNPPQAYTVRDAMILCGVNDEDQFNGMTAAQRFAADIFSNSFCNVPR